MIYLSAPLTDPIPHVRESRVRAATWHLARMWREGLPTYSPLTVGGQIAEYCEDKTHEWWMSHCLPFLDRSDEMVILTLPGWKESEGVAIEVKFAQTVGIPIYTIEPCSTGRWIGYQESRDRLSRVEAWPALLLAEIPTFKASRFVDRPGVSAFEMVPD